MAMIGDNQTWSYKHWGELFSRIHLCNTYIPFKQKASDYRADFLLLSFFSSQQSGCVSKRVIHNMKEKLGEDIKDLVV